VADHDVGKKGRAHSCCDRLSPVATCGMLLLMMRKWLLGWGLSLLLVTVGGACAEVKVAAGGDGGSGGSAGGSGSSGAGGFAGMGGVGGNGGAAGQGGASGQGGAGGGQPDLAVESIGSPSISCPGGSGTCVTTVEIGIENLGDGDAPAFNFAVTLDPGQTVVVGQSVPGGLAAGASQSFTITTPQGGNCYDPDCTISVRVDDLNDVVESDETNNTDSSTTLG
jgi:hypothetical protein